MDFTKLDNLLWAASFVGHVTLLCVLLLRRRWREFPVFTILIGWDAALTAVLFGLYYRANKDWYTKVYWSSVVVDFVLQLGVVYEITRVVLRPTGTWVRDAWRQFLLWGSAGVLVAAVFAWTVSPPAKSFIESFEVRGNLFTSLVICELFVVMTMASNRLGLGWRSHVMAIAQGLTAWAAVAVVIDALHSFLGAEKDFSPLEHVRMFVYLGALAFWIVQLWVPEPQRQPISPELQEIIVALRKRVRYDLGRLDIER